MSMIKADSYPVYTIGEKVVLLNSPYVFKVVNRNNNLYKLKRIDTYYYSESHSSYEVVCENQEILGHYGRWKHLSGNWIELV